MSNSTKRNPVNSGNYGDLQPLKQTFVRAHWNSSTLPQILPNNMALTKVTFRSACEAKGQQTKDQKKMYGTSVNAGTVQ